MQRLLGASIATGAIGWASSDERTPFGTHLIEEPREAGVVSVIAAPQIEQLRDLAQQFEQRFVPIASGEEMVQSVLGTVDSGHVGNLMGRGQTQGFANGNGVIDQPRLAVRSSFAQGGGERWRGLTIPFAARNQFTQLLASGGAVTVHGGDQSGDTGISRLTNGELKFSFVPARCAALVLSGPAFRPRLDVDTQHPPDEVRQHGVIALAVADEHQADHLRATSPFSS